MLAEGFLRVLLYREERKFANASRRHKTQTHSHPDPSKSSLFNSNSTDLQTDSTTAGSNHEDLESSRFQGLRVLPQDPAGLLIPGCSPALTHNHDYTVCIDDCSLLKQYPDLQVADSGRISHNLLRAATPEQDLYTAGSDGWATQQEPQGDLVSSVPDQGYLVMGASVNMSLDLPGSGLEPMSNSVLNGLLEKQLEEVYMQHLTDNLARCNSHLGNSLLHGLVPPPQRGSQQQGPDSLVVTGLEESGETDRKISYLNTHNLVPYSSNFSSPVLRISETDNIHQ